MAYLEPRGLHLATGVRPFLAPRASLPGPLDIELNVAVRRMCELVLPMGYDLTDNEDEAPRSLDDVDAMFIRRNGAALIWRGGSDNTIYADLETNWAFRAWHDWTHWIARAEFDLNGELHVAHRQCRDLSLVYGDGQRVQSWHRLIMGEVYGQALYKAGSGEYTKDQPTVTVRMAEALRQSGWVLPPLRGFN